MLAKGSASPRSVELLVVLGKIGLALKRWMRSNLPTDGGMTVPRATLLSGLADRDEAVGMSELGELLGQSPRSMTVLADGLENEGLVRRVPHESDRRITRVEITKAGKQLAKKALGPAQLRTAALLEDLTPEEQKELLRLMMKLADSLRARGIEVPAH